MFLKSLLLTWILLSGGTCLDVDKKCSNPVISQQVACLFNQQQEDCQIAKKYEESFAKMEFREVISITRELCQARGQDQNHVMCLELRGSPDNLAEYPSLEEWNKLHGQNWKNYKESCHKKLY